MSDGTGGADLRRFGVAVGHATDAAGATGCTVVRGAAHPLRGACAVFGRATGTRELALLEPGHLVDRVDAVLVTGGSAYGLAAADGVMRWMEENGRGFPAGGGVVPIVPAAVLFDLQPLGRFDARPTPQMGYDACDGATARGVAEGSVGAGTGLTVGKVLGPGACMKGGLGIAVVDASEAAACAIAAVNAFGDVCDAEGRVLAGARHEGGCAGTERVLATRGLAGAFGGAHNTTVAVIVVDGVLDKLALQGVARAAGAALHRRVRPAGSLVDGDVIFALSPLTGAPADPVRAEMLAVAALEQAIERAVRTAVGREGVPGLAG
ncbi:MAG: P1 family peptidase [Gemmatimonadetes bacterium]|nr:P1 family peptidase [Gemmatimonadota bacterium]